MPTNQQDSTRRDSTFTSITTSTFKSRMASSEQAFSSRSDSYRTDSNSSNRSDISELLTAKHEFPAYEQRYFNSSDYTLSQIVASAENVKKGWGDDYRTRAIQDRFRSWGSAGGKSLYTGAKSEAIQQAIFPTITNRQDLIDKMKELKILADNIDIEGSLGETQSELLREFNSHPPKKFGPNGEIHGNEDISAVQRATLTSWAKILANKINGVIKLQMELEPLLGAILTCQDEETKKLLRESLNEIMQINQQFSKDLAKIGSCSKSFSNLMKNITEIEPSESSGKLPTIGDLLSAQEEIASESLQHINILQQNITSRIVSRSNVTLPKIGGRGGIITGHNQSASVVRKGGAKRRPPSRGFN